MIIANILIFVAISIIVDVNGFRVSTFSTFSNERSSFKSISAIHKNSLKSRSKLSSLPIAGIVPDVTAVFSARTLAPVVAGGLLAGGLHAISGPDHIAAIMPASVGGSTASGLKAGAIWGLGHAFSAMAIGLIASTLSGRISRYLPPNILDKLGVVMESAVGLSLVTIGIVGLQESLSPPHDDHHNEKSSTNIPAIFANGLLHGFSWDGAPSLAPALGMKSWQSVLSFLTSYGLGTMVAMSAAAGILSESTKRIGSAVSDDRAKVTKSITTVSSALAMAIGVYWTIKPFLH